MDFFRVFRSAVEQFGISLCHTKDAQTHKIILQLETQGVETKKRHLYSEENFVLGRKPQRKIGFLLFLGLY